MTTEHPDHHTPGVNTDPPPPVHTPITETPTPCTTEATAAFTSENGTGSQGEGVPARVIEAPHRSSPSPPDALGGEEIVEGELVTDDGSDGQLGAGGGPTGAAGVLALRTPGRTLAGLPVSVTRRVTVSVITTVRTVSTHPHTRHTAKALARHLYYLIAGSVVVAKRWRDAHGGNRYERVMRQAELVGDREMLLEWEARDTAEKQRRHERVMDWVHSPWELLRALLVTILTGTGLLLGLGLLLAIADSDLSRVLGPIIGVIHAIAFTAWFCSVYGSTLLLATTVGVVALLWHTGRAHTQAPTWLASEEAGEAGVREVIPDEGAILGALSNLGIAEFNRKLKAGWRPRWVLATCRDGRGYRTQLELPSGVNVEMINKKKPLLAHNLVRLPVEVWPTEPKTQPGVLDLWVADQGVLSGPVEPYPLLEAGTTDYFSGVPAGVDQRGELVLGKLMGANYAVAGIMGSGKTSLVVELLAGAMLDPLVDLQVYVMAYNVDYDPLAPRLSVLVKGDEAAQVHAAITALQNLREEVTTRGKLLAELGGEETKLTRTLAERDARMRPKVVVFDECQELFRDEHYGAQAKELAIKVMMKARKCGITLIWVTPAPSADSLPRDLAKTVSHRVCFAIGDHQGNDAILGTGAHKRGITAVDLVAGEDAGTAMATGFSPRPGLIRTHHIRKDATIDQLTPIVARALAPWQRKAPRALEADPQLKERDLLSDVAAVLGGAPRVRTQIVLHRLAELDPSAYEHWSFQDLTAALADYGVEVGKSQGNKVIRASEVTQALTDRDTETAPESDDEAGS
ncbi:MAG: cell division protein FtsK [Pseudonocardiales bacterium]|nr:cell division protein FtsK [Pseudonocardiales bacterium]